jgi:hypothetical protein
MAKGDKFGMGSVGTGYSNNYSGWTPEVNSYVTQVQNTQPMDYLGGIKNYNQRQAIEWANQQRMTDPAYWAQAFGASGGGSVGKPVYQDTAGAYRKRLNSLMDNPDSIANTGAYKFAFNQGNEAINRNLAARGLLKSGNRLTELTKFGQGLASQQYGAEMDRLSNLVSSTRSGDIAKYGADANLYGTELQGQNQLKALMMENAMKMQKRYMPPGTHYTAGGIVNRWD